LLLSGTVGKTYKIQAIANSNGTFGNGFTLVDIKNGYLAPSARMLYLGAILFLVLLIVVVWPIKKAKSRQKRNLVKLGRQLKKVLIFALISGIVLNPLASFLLLDIEVGKNSPVGLIKKEIILNDTKQTQWYLNVGGNNEDNYKAGIQIPIYILIFGIIGGYVRYLYDTYDSRKGGLAAPVIDYPTGEPVDTRTPQIRGTGEASTNRWQLQP